MIECRHFAAARCGLTLTRGGPEAFKLTKRTWPCWSPRGASPRLLKPYGPTTFCERALSYL
jgi:hypothetical protein